MKTRNSTKSKLLSSVIALVLCVSMLIGATFAWFTDTASTGVNKIMAGTLNVEVEYSTNGTRWATIEDATSLFSNNLWEPGHTEYVYLRVKNAGTLGLKYKVMVTPVSENGGINVNNENFKLSDNLVFGTKTLGETFTPFADRTAARDAVNGIAKGLRQADLVKENSIIANGADQYLALVVYMPESVGNEANAKPGTVAPSINLGVTVVATQLEAENDSFNNTYDADADENAPEYVVGPTYNYFPQVMASASVAATGDTVITASGKLNASDATPTTLAKVTVPAAAVAAGAEKLTVTVVPKEPEAATTNGTALVTEINDPNRETANFDVKVDGIANSNTASINVEIFVGKGLVNVKVYHNGALINGTGYDPTTGIVSFTTTSFSDFTVAYDAAVAAIGTKTYGSLANAFAAVKSGETITLLKSSAGNGIKVPSGKNFTVDFNSYTYDVNGELVGSSGTKTNSLQLLQGSTITFKNGTLTSSNSTYASQILIQNYSNLTLDNMTVSAGVPFDYIVSNNNGNVVIKDTTINAAEGKVAFDVCRYASYVGPEVTVEGNSVINGNVEISCSGAKEGATHKLNVTGGTFNGKFVKYDSPNFVGNITGGTFSSDPASYLAEGKMAVLGSDGMYTVENDPRVKTEEQLKAAIEAGGEVTLGADIPLTSTLSITKDVTLNLGAYTISGKEKSAAVALKNDSGTIKVVVNATTGGITASGSNGNCFEMPSNNKGTVELTINGGNYSSTKAYLVNINAGSKTPDGRRDKLFINGGTYSGNRIINANPANTEIMITDGTLTGTSGGINFGTNSQNAKLTMTGGKLKYENGSVIVAQASGNTIDIRDNAVVTGKLSLKNCTMNITGGTVNITGDNKDNRAIMVSGGTTLNISGNAKVSGDPLFNMNGGTVNITGGMFSGKIVNGLNYGDESRMSVNDLLSAQYQLSDPDSEGWYQVVPNE